MTEKKLNLGSAGYKKEGYINVDWQSLVKPDVEHDLNVFPYPFSDNEFDLIEAYHVLEHLDRPFEVMREIRRIIKPGGRVIIRVPHFSRGMTHAEHAHGFDVTFPLYFNPLFAKSGYFGVPFALESMKLHWLAHWHVFTELQYNRIFVMFLRIVHTIISFLANLSPNFCSRIWCFWVGGFDEIEYHFRPVK